MWEMIESVSWRGHEVLIEKAHGMVRASVWIDNHLYFGYSTGDDLRFANTEYALIDLENVLRKHADGTYLEYAKQHYNSNELINAQNSCRGLFGSI